MTVTPLRPTDIPPIPSSTTTIIRIQRGVSLGLGAALTGLGLALAIASYGVDVHGLMTGLACVVVGAICFQIAASRDAQLTVTAEQQRLGKRMTSVLQAEETVLGILDHRHHG